MSDGRLLDGPHAQCPVCRLVMRAPADAPDAVLAEHRERLAAEVRGA